MEVIKIQAINKRQQLLKLKVQSVKAESSIGIFQGRCRNLDHVCQEEQRIYELRARLYRGGVEIKRKIILPERRR